MTDPALTPREQSDLRTLAAWNSGEAGVALDLWAPLAHEGNARAQSNMGAAFLEGRGVDADIFLAETAFQREVIDRHIVAEVDGLRVKLVSAEDLILFKLVASRPRDLVDIQDILFTQGRLDEAYLRHWAGPLGVSEKLEAALLDRP